ncbi:hypothetical protein ACIHFD_34495 [Nonomuraea sp. NPDC051941]|uniref:hypothetical protein n=1 Tax=Nonomuraea sp. NPDC051941 TaxID=3364373 RepID=UPI0037C8FECE
MRSERVALAAGREGAVTAKGPPPRPERAGGGPDAGSGRMIRIVPADEHPVVRSGLRAVGS